MLRKLIAAGALALVAMCLAVPVAYADVGSSFHPMEVSSHVMEVNSHDMALEVVAANCSTSPAWTAVAAPDGTIDVERLSTCANDFHFGSGSLVADVPDDQPIPAFCAVEPRLMPSTDGDQMRIDDPGWCLT